MASETNLHKRMRIFTKEHKKKISKSLKGRTAWNKGTTGLQIAWNKGLPMKKETKEKISGENNRNWKGGDVGYSGVHKWIRKTFGSAKKCCFSDLHKGLVYEWANVSGSYNRSIDDWTQLCAKCHRDYDNLLKGIYPRDKKNGRFLKSTYIGSAYYGVGNKFA